MGRQKGFIAPLVLVLLVLAIGILVTIVILQSRKVHNQQNNSNSAIDMAQDNQNNNAYTDFPPLYPGAEWGEPEEGNYLFPDTEKVSVELPGVYYESLNAQQFDDTNTFFNYYSSNLLHNGWVLDSEAGGPDGDVYTYKKYNAYMIIRTKMVSDNPPNFLFVLTISK